MELQGKIKEIGRTKEYGSNGFKKRELVITSQEEYPQSILVEFVQDKCPVLDNYKVGQLVKIGINIRGREWQNPQGETKYFNSIQGWKIEQLEVPGETFEAAPPAPDNQPDDLPF